MLGKPGHLHVAPAVSNEAVQIDNFTLSLSRFQVAEIVDNFTLSLFQVGEIVDNFTLSLFQVGEIVDNFTLSLFQVGEIVDNFTLSLFQVGEIVDNLHCPCSKWVKLWDTITVKGEIQSSFKLSQ